MMKTVERHGWASFGTLALMVALTQMPSWFAGTRVAKFAERIDVSLRTADVQRDDLDALLAGYYEALVRQATNLTTRPDFLQFAYRPHVVSKERPGQLLTNSFGMFDREYTREKPVGTRRMALIGDSISVGVFGQNFETLLEDRLNRYQRTPKVSFEILNLSVEGYLLTQLVDVAWHHAALFSPDVYLVALTQRSVTRKWTFHVGKLLKEGVDLQYDFLRQVTAQAGVRPTDSLSRMDRKLALFHERVLSWSLAQLQLAAAYHKAKLVVLLVPFTVFDPAIDAQFERARLELEAVHVPVVDLRDSFAGETDMRQLRMSRDDFHPNTRGHRLLADNLYRRILGDPEVSAAILGSAPAKP